MSEINLPENVLKAIDWIVLNIIGLAKVAGFEVSEQEAVEAIKGLLTKPVTPESE